MTDISNPERLVVEVPRRTWLRPELMRPWWEIAAVLLVIIGYSSFSSGWQAWHGSSHRYTSELLTDNRMVRTLSTESGILGLLLIYLHRRGWRPADLKIRITWTGSAQGLLLLPAMIVANFVVVALGYTLLYSLQSHSRSFLSFVAANGPHLKFHSIHVSWLAMIPALIFNGFFEEITTMGYAFCQFASRRGPLFALILTVLLRMSCHTYQGPVHALGIGAAFTVSGLFYWWTRNLWPLIFAHIVLDAISFGAIKLIYGS
jgi:membrane protease YdiL (CAAX protease family)